ncbi:hypothetical protein JZ751_010129 [Albula glossodonta]|uniref:Pyrin domain-containing protein n=1 Tax=Albula glossodonta TaxID=121402 RepID=A0A8T2NBA1_9TELE|nr:hypothetical protein JZ751_010129 [Albula glossodonta]
MYGGSEIKCSAMAGVPGLLASTLDELLAEELKRFRWNLTHDVPLGFCPIPKGKLQNRDVPDTVDQMLDSYGEEGAVKVTLHILKKTRHHNLAQTLEKDYRSVEAHGARDHGQAGSHEKKCSIQAPNH